MLKKSILILFIALIFFNSPVIARDPYPDKPRIKYMVAPGNVENPYKDPTTNPATMLQSDGKRSNIISFQCYNPSTGARHFLNDLNINTNALATDVCNSYPGTVVLPPLLANNKNIDPSQLKYNYDGYDWPIGRFLGRDPQAEKAGFYWANEVIYSAQEGTPNACGASGIEPCDCIYTPLIGPKSSWIRLYQGSKDAPTRECVAPPYTTSGDWWNAYLDMLNTKKSKIPSGAVAMGIYLGIDGEGRPLKSEDSNWKTWDGSDLNFNFYKLYIPAVIKWTKDNYFSSIVIRSNTDPGERDYYLNNNIDFHRESLASDQSEAYYYKGLNGSFGWWQGFANNYWVTNSQGMAQTWPPAYYSILAGLSMHTDYLTGIQDDLFYPYANDFLSFVGRYMGKDINDTLGVWTALRETMWKRGTVPDGNGGYRDNMSGKYGDYDYFLYRSEDLTDNQTDPIRFTEIKSLAPLAKNQLYAYENSPYGLNDNNNLFVGRRNKNGQHYMSFNVDDGYRYTGKASSYNIRIVYLDIGNGSFKFQYKNQSNELVEKIINKNDIKIWQEAKFSISNALFNNNTSDIFFNGNKYPTDFRIYTGDGTVSNNTIIHLVEVQGIGDSPENPNRIKSQVSCNLVSSQDSDEKNGPYSYQVGQDVIIKARLVDNNNNPIIGQKIMFTYNTEWNLASTSDSTNNNGLSYFTLNTANRVDSSGFLGGNSLYSIQVYFPGNRQYQPSRNDCTITMTSEHGNTTNDSHIIITSDPLITTDNIVQIGYRIVSRNGTVIDTHEDPPATFGRAQGFNIEDSNTQTIPIIFQGNSTYYASTNHFTIKGNGQPYPTAPPPTGGPTNTPIPSPTPDVCPDGNKGNINCDQQKLIDETDLNILLSSWSPNGPVPTPPSNQRHADLNNDSKVNNDDVNFLITNWKTN